MSDTDGRVAWSGTDAEVGALRDTVRRLESALTAARVGTWFWDVEHDELYWDSAMYALCGVTGDGSPGEGDRMRNCVHPDDKAALETAVRRALDSGASVAVEYRVIWPDGSVKILSTRGEPAADASGRARRIAGACWDVTERRQVEKVLRRREQLLEMVRQVSVLLIDAAPPEIDALISDTLRQVGEFAGVDRAHVYRVTEDPAFAECTHEWCAPGMVSAKQQLARVTTAPLHWALGREGGSKIVAIGDMDALPAEAEAVRRMAAYTGARSWMLLPLERGGRFIGGVDLAMVRSQRQWSQEDIDLLLLVGEMLANAVERQRATTVLQSRLEYDALLSSLSNVMSHTSDSDVARAVQSSLGMIAGFVGCEHGFIASGRLEVSSEWTAAGLAPIGSQVAVLWSAASPWAIDQLGRHRCLRVPNVAALPPEAGEVRALLEGMGLRSVLIVARLGGDSSVNLLGCASSAPRERWRDEDVLMLRMAGDMIRTEEARHHENLVSSALARAGRELIRVVDEESILRRICELATELIGADACLLLLVHEGEGAYEPVASHGVDAQQWDRLRLMRFPVGMVERTAGGALLNDVAQLRSGVDAGPVVAMQERLGFSAGLHTQLRRAGEVVGTIVVLRRAVRSGFTDSEGRVVVGLSQLASFAIANARLVDELEAANRVKSDFVATMSHELRTPLNIIIGYDDLLLEGAFGEVGEDQRDVLRRMGRSSRSLLQMIEATLTLGRLERGRLIIAVRPVDLAALVAELEAETWEMREKEGVVYHSEVARPLPQVRTDAVNLKMVLRNLLENAFKFTTAGSVSLALRAANGGVQFTVTDTGTGIEAEALPVVFEAFRQGSDQTAVRPGGVGLGLFIVQRLLDLLGGTIAVDSVVGRGTVFHVWLPIDPTSSSSNERISRAT